MKQAARDLLKRVSSYKNFLIIQDIDGVCIPLVKDPLSRKLDSEYVYAASRFSNKFFVLTNGEHGGYRGVNKIIEDCIEDKSKVLSEGLYLPGLAAGGVELQNRYGEIKHPGVNEKMLDFLDKVPELMRRIFSKKIKELFPLFAKELVDDICKISILDTKFSPTINLNKLFDIIPNEVQLRRKVQNSLLSLMEEILTIAKNKGLNDSFHLHIAPNLGENRGKEIIKYATKADIGTTDIQFMVKGAIKEAGLVVLINEYFKHIKKKPPFGENLNVMELPQEIDELIHLCSKKINKEEMPILIGVGDTITSTYDSQNQIWMRGGSDRGFLTMIQELGKTFEKENQVIVVDSSGGEVNRPTLKDPGHVGITDPEDTLKFDLTFEEGPSEYIQWFIALSDMVNKDCYN